MNSVQISSAFTLILITVIVSVRQANIKEKYLSTWVGFLLCPIFGLILQEPLISVSKKLGFKVYSNFVFTSALIWLGLITFQILISLSKSEKKIEILAEEIAILKSINNEK